MKFRFVWKKICHADRNSPNFVKFPGKFIKRSKIIYQVVIDYRPGQNGKNDRKPLKCPNSPRDFIIRGSAHLIKQDYSLLGEKFRPR